MKKHFYLLCILLISTFSVKSQDNISLSGTVTAVTSSSPVSGASVYVLNTNTRTATNAEGKFTVSNLLPGQYAVQVMALGYATLSKTVAVADGTAQLDFQLTDASRQLDEVTVTAQKTEEDPQQVPFSLSVLSARQVQAYQLRNTKDITAIVPNLYSANPGDNRNVTSIRGITTTSYDPAVVTYIDGVNQFGLDTYVAQLLDIERVEVLRGPQGTLYGRNAMGGVVNIITEQPANELTGFAEINAGNYGQQRYSAGFNVPLVNDKLFLGAAGLYSRLNGYYTNQFNNSKFDEQHSFMGNYYLKYLAASNLSVTLNVKHNENRNDGTFPLVASKDDALANPFVVNQNALTTIIDNIFNSSLSVNYSGKAFNFTSQTAYQSNLRYYTEPIDADFSPIDGISLIYDYGGKWNRVKAGTQEFRFTSPASASAFKWAAGVYGFYQDSPVKQGTYFGEDAELVGAPFPNFTSINTNQGNSRGIAFYGQGTYALLPKLEATLGLRYDYERKEQSVLGEFEQQGEVIVTRPDTSATANFNAVTPKVSLAWHPTENQNLYATYSRGFRAGGITQLSSDPSQPPLVPYKPEHSSNFEIGLKNTLLDKRLRINIAAFYTRVTDAQVPTLILPDAIVVTRNAGKLSSKGAELELAATPANGLEIAYNLGYTDAKYTELVLPVNGEAVQLNDNRQIFTPDITSMLALQYGYEVNKDKNVRLILRGEWKYLGKQYFDLANQVSQDAYSLFNVRAGLSARKFDVFFWAANIADKRYVDYAYEFGAAHLGNPATYGISVSTRL